MGDSWLDVMPAIPLADYLGPVRTPQDLAWKAVVIGHDIAPDVCHVVTSQGESEGGTRPWLKGNGWLAEEILRPDLDRHEGFGFAIWWLGGQRWMPPMEERHRHAERGRRYILRQTTEDDKLGLARAIAEVTS